MKTMDDKARLYLIKEYYSTPGEPEFADLDIKETYKAGYAQCEKDSAWVSVFDTPEIKTKPYYINTKDYKGRYGVFLVSSDKDTFELAFRGVIGYWKYIDSPGED